MNFFDVPPTPSGKLDISAIKDLMWPIIAIIVIIYAIMVERSRTHKKLQEESKELVETTEKNKESGEKKIKDLETSLTVSVQELFATREILRSVQEKYDKLKLDYLRVEEALDRCRGKLSDTEK
jgi:hypothetical protein